MAPFVRTVPRHTYRRHSGRKALRDTQLTLCPLARKVKCLSSSDVRPRDSASISLLHDRYSQKLSGVALRLARKEKRLTVAKSVSGLKRSERHLPQGGHVTSSRKYSWLRPPSRGHSSLACRYTWEPRRSVSPKVSFWQCCMRYARSTNNS